MTTPNLSITLAYPYGEHEPDATIELPDEEARALIRAGRARLPEDGVTHVDVEPEFDGGSPEHLGGMTLAQYQGTSSGAVLSSPGDTWGGDLDLDDASEALTLTAAVGGDPDALDATGLDDVAPSSEDADEDGVSGS